MEQTKTRDITDPQEMNSRRVGHATTSILENELLKYIEMHTEHRENVRPVFAENMDINLLIIYNALKLYNRGFHYDQNEINQ